mmetsp:Transcript_19232/g.39751  ORF Transcript_19232/g.39751 Transcript_19232/m.39751 type:complete len:455 (+) Transcript_19232:1621-2985(+)
MCSVEIITTYSLVFIITFGSFHIGSHFFVILFKSRQILTSFREFTFFHTFSHKPVDERSFRVHEIKLVVNARQSFGNGRCIGHHTNSAINFCQVTSGNVAGLLVVDSALEASGTPVNKLDRTLVLNGCHSRIDILGHHITTIHETTGHVLSVTRIALGHHATRFKDRTGDFRHAKVFMGCLFLGDNGGIGRQHEMNTRVGHQVCLEFGDIHIQSTIKAKGSSEGRDDLGNQTIQVGVGRVLNSQVAGAHIVKSFVIQGEGTISVFQKSMGGQDTVVGFNNRGTDLGRGGQGEGKLGLAAIVHTQALQQQTSKSRTCSSSGGMEDQEPLQSGTVIRELADTVQDRVDNFLSSGVMATGVVVGSIFLSIDDLFRMVKVLVGSTAYFITDRWFQVSVDRTGNVLSRGSLTEEGVEGVILFTWSGVRGHFARGFDPMLEAVELPALVSDLDTTLAQMN